MSKHLVKLIANEDKLLEKLVERELTRINYYNAKFNEVENQIKNLRHNQEGNGNDTYEHIGGKGEE